jgi:hypothetical protein
LQRPGVDSSVLLLPAYEILGNFLRSFKINYFICGL